MNDDNRLFSAAFQQAAAALGLVIDAARQERMFAHYLQVVQTNKQFNLTRITSPAEAAVKHYADSLALLVVPGFSPDRRLEVLDLGTGAGFPAVPLAIVCESWPIMAIDATGKKARFVEEAAESLGLQNLRVRHARGGDLAREGGHQFDAVLLRAVTKMDEGLTEAAPLVRKGGSVIFYKTPHIERAEIESAERIADQKGFKHSDHFDLTLPSHDGPIARRLIRYRRG